MKFLFRLNWPFFLPTAGLTPKNFHTTKPALLLPKGATLSGQNLLMAACV
jgi:hypothetical protein